MDYTEEQKTIFAHPPERHARILAGPGTGKSSTIIAYIDVLRREHPQKVVRLLTFTRAANRELADKVLQAGHEQLISSTIHSFAISLLLGNPGTSGLPEPIRIADDWEWKELIRADLARRLGVSVRVVEKLKAEMSANWESLNPEEDTSIPADVRARFMGMWDEHRRILGYSLLSELPFRLKNALEGNPDFDVGNIELLAIDEYQDLNACDLECFRLLAERGIALIAIGDDDQSIYQFRKAHPDGIRRFVREYEAANYSLTVSHRCGRRILEWANHVIGGDTGRAEKPALRPAEGNPDGLAQYFVFNREAAEAQGVVRLVRSLTNTEGVPLEEIFILARTGAILDRVKTQLREADVSYSDPDEALGILRANDTRVLLAMLRLLLDRADSLAWLTLLRFTPGFGRQTINQFYESARGEGCSLGDAILRAANSVYWDISQRRGLIAKKVDGVLELVDGIKIPRETQWGEWIIEQVEHGALPQPATGMTELLTRIDEERAGVREQSLAEYVNQVEPTCKDILNAKTEGSLRIMNLTRSKGLTVEATILVGAEDGLIPHPRGDRQEERRLLYVGMTRARKYLFLTRCRRRADRTAWSGRANVGGRRQACPFLTGGPVRETDGDRALAELGIK